MPLTKKKLCYLFATVKYFLSDVYNNYALNKSMWWNENWTTLFLYVLEEIQVVKKGEISSKWNKQYFLITSQFIFRWGLVFPEVIELLSSLPVQKFPPVINVIWSLVFMIQIISMFPDVNNCDWVTPTCQWTVLIGCAEYLKFSICSVSNQPNITFLEHKKLPM